MKEQVLNRAKAFKGINALAIRGEVVIFGSTYMANFPFYELINKSRMENAIYNRSIADMTLPEAEVLLQDCVLDIQPDKIFLNLGEKDFDRDDAVEIYTKIVHRICGTLPAARIYLIALQDEKAKQFNKQIAALCNGKNIHFINFSAQNNGNYKGQFKELSCFFRSKPLNMIDAFAIASL